MPTLYCLTVPCHRAVGDAADEPLAATACLLALLALICRRWGSSRNLLLSFAALLWLFSHGRYGRWRDTANFPAAACQALGVTHLEHVPPLESERTQGEAMWRAGNETWTRGHYPYRECANGTALRQLPRVRPARTLVVLLPASEHYKSVVGPWARTVRAAGLECVVGRLDRSEALCDIARLGGCRCVQSATTLPTLPTNRPSGDFGRGSMRATAVRARFELAAALLRESPPKAVLMHDADASFTTPLPLRKLGAYLHDLGTAGAANVAVLSNGRRASAFDDLNWGFVWLDGSVPSSLHVLECVLSSWEHTAFAPHREDPLVGGQWHSRSQPRINHIIERALVAGGEATAGGVQAWSGHHGHYHGQRSAPRVCLLPSTMVASLKHGTYSNVPTSTAKDKVSWLLHHHEQAEGAVEDQTSEVELAKVMETICARRPSPHRDGCESSLGIRSPPLPSVAALAGGHRKQAGGTRHDEALLVRARAFLYAAAVRASLRFGAVTAPLTYRSTGVFFSEALALIGALEATHATHFIESGTASGVSTELIARHFAAAPKSRPQLNITTIDRDQLYHLFQATTARFHRLFPNVRCLRADSMVRIPALLDALPDGARVIVFVDGPKGALGLKLLETALAHPRVVLGALHDAAPMWSTVLHKRMRQHPQHLLHTSDAPFRTAFGELDTRHSESEVLLASNRTGPALFSLQEMLRGGPGLWLAGHSNLMRGEPLHVALGADRRQLLGLLGTLGSLLRHAVAPSRLHVHVFTLSAEAALIARAVECVVSEVGGGATVRVVPVEEPAEQGSRNATAAASLAPGAVPQGSSSTVSAAWSTEPPPSASSARRFGVALSLGIDLARFHLPRLLPRHVRKVLWLDADVLVLDDVASLIDSAFHGDACTKAVAAVARRKPLLKALNLSKADAAAAGLRLEPHAVLFNAGVLLLNLDEWRRRELTTRLGALATRLSAQGYQGMPGLSLATDSQSVLALYFQGGSAVGSGSGSSGDVEWLPMEWNVDGLGWKLHQLSEATLHTARLLHWSGGDKPWHAPRGPCRWTLERGRVCGSVRHQRLRDMWREHSGEPSRCLLT